MSTIVEKRRTDCPGLPPGWKKEEVVRKSGISAGRTDIYYFSPDEKKIRSKPQLARALGDNFDLSCFDFRAGKVMQSALRKRLRHDMNLVLPIRQTASIFKQPVTVIRTRPESKKGTNLKHVQQEQPRQLFWEKRMQGLRACDVNEKTFKQLELPRNIQGAGPDLSTGSLLQSIAACLHNNSNQPVMGQSASRAALLKNPNAHINVDQPLIQAVIITEDDIRRQEMKVKEARKKLEEVMME